MNAAGVAEVGDASGTRELIIALHGFWSDFVLSFQQFEQVFDGREERIRRAVAEVVVLSHA